MEQLRWILLGAGVLLIAGIYLWGLRARRRSAAPAADRVVRVEPARTVPVVPDAPQRIEPEVGFDEQSPDEPEPFDGDASGEVEPAPRRPLAAARREPRLEPRLEPRVQAEHRSAAEPRRVEPAAEPARKPSSQKIVALRIVAAPGSQFEGARLLETLQADGFAFGRYQIFHRADEEGRPVVSLASLKEPGTFDLQTMPETQFRGMALFAVMPGPLPGLRAFDELIVTARALAATLGGQLQDERGGPLTLQRIAHLRDEVAEFERARGPAPGA